MDTVSPTLTGQPATQGAVQPGASPLPGATSGLFGSAGKYNPGILYNIGSTASSIGGVYGSITAGKQAKAQFDIQAGQYATQAEIVKVNASEQANLLRKQLLADIGSANASAAARGIDTGSGTPRQIVQESISNVESDIARLKAGSVIAASGSTTSAARAAISGEAAQQAGYYRATQSLVTNALR